MLVRSGKTKVGFGDASWTYSFVNNSYDFYRMAKKINEFELAQSFLDQAERAIKLVDNAKARSWLLNAHRGFIENMESVG